MEKVRMAPEITPEHAAFAARFKLETLWREMQGVNDELHERGLQFYRGQEEQRVRAEKAEARVRELETEMAAIKSANAEKLETKAQ